MIGEQLPLVRVIAEDVDGSGHLVAGGVGARHQDAAREHPQFGHAQAVAVVLGADQIGEQVLGGRLAAVGDHGVDIVVEFTPGRQDFWLVFGRVPGERLEELVGPGREQVAVLVEERRAARR